ncbi:DUF3772 domain-containing protein [Phaeobacter marinintestinus]|uniref:DUF3772 domain-containing protein n=1 Tax=Falsiphaeobacter marinintestinus TaxID=1492905 RepID=UPI001FEB702F|nr:DUF3772 domain-containing protein [Phaeobacter marinintestinus]
MTVMGRALTCLLAALFLWVAVPAHAQLSDEGRDYYANWIKVADRAEQVVDANRASSAAMEKLRADIVQYRELFNKVRNENSARIKTLEAQVASLPAPPGEGEEEAQDIADLRAHLTGRLDKLRVPRIVAEEAYSRSDGLISEIDRIIRERQRKKLLSRGPSPLLPDHWALFYQDFVKAAKALVNETEVALSLDSTRENIRDNAFIILLWTMVGLVLIVRGTHWANRFGDFMRRFGGSGSGVWSFVVSLAKIVLPFLGTVALIEAITTANVLGLRGQLILESVPQWAAVFLIYHWIGTQTIGRRDDNERLIKLSPVRLAELRVYVDLLAVMIVLLNMVNLFERIENISEPSRAVAAFPIIVTTALILFRLQFFRAQPKPANEGEEETPRRAGFSAIVRVLRRGLFLLSAAAPILAAAGYVYAAEALIFPAVNTLALIAVIIVLQQFLGDFAAWATGRPEVARDSLFTVIVGFVLSALALPVLVLIWGGRVANLTEIWSQFLAGFEVGDTTFAPVTIVAAAAIFGVGYMVTRLLQSGLRNSLLPKTNIDAGGQNAIVSGTGYVGIVIAALVAITGAGMDLSSLAIVAGALSVGIGFGLQTIVSNFVSGIILLIERPISKGDWISVGGMMGYVRDISVRATRIETFDRTDVIVPNSDLISGSVVNYTRGNTIGRVIVPVGVAYGTDTRKVEAVLREVANCHPMILANPAPNVVFQGFGADSMDFEIRAILRDVNWSLTVKSELNHEIAKAFAEAEIEIPFAQRDIWLRNPEVLRQPLTVPDKTEVFDDVLPQGPVHPDAEDVSSG